MLFLGGVVFLFCCGVGLFVLVFWGFGFGCFGVGFYCGVLVWCLGVFVGLCFFVGFGFGFVGGCFVEGVGVGVGGCFCFFWGVVECDGVVGGIWFGFLLWLGGGWFCVLWGGGCLVGGGGYWMFFGE
uniref:NADH dehydrogenase subunit 6 n=1 Tax=Knipowitschia caucasica TaxID=637954 RepID=A0AAV2M099_KNICA